MDKDIGEVENTQAGSLWKDIWQYLSRILERSTFQPAGEIQGQGHKDTHRYELATAMLCMVTQPESRHRVQQQGLAPELLDSLTMECHAGNDTCCTG